MPSCTVILWFIAPSWLDLGIRYRGHVQNEDVTGIVSKDGSIDKSGCLDLADAPWHLLCRWVVGRWALEPRCSSPGGQTMGPSQLDQHVGKLLSQEVGDS